MKRDILKIDDELCNGCGKCVPNCHEGALQVIDGKVRLVSELLCDGLGACIGHCPEGAIEIESREAEPYSEALVMSKMKAKGRNTITAHMKHLKDHGEAGFLKEAVMFLRTNRTELDFNPDSVISEVHNHGKTAAVPAGLQSAHQHAHDHQHQGGCPGSRTMVLEQPEDHEDSKAGSHQPSELRQWPVQM